MLGCGGCLAHGQGTGGDTSCSLPQCWAPGITLLGSEMEGWGKVLAEAARSWLRGLVTRAGELGCKPQGAIGVCVIVAVLSCSHKDWASG